MKSALGDVRVIEYGHHLSAPYCAKLLADLGAEVIKVEEPDQGDIARRRGPFLGDIPGKERSGLFLYLNTNKLGVTLNFEKMTGKEIFKRLLKNADILIEDTKPGKMEALGLSYKDLKSLNPSLIMTSITPFGLTGPYKDYKGSELIGWHMGGAGLMNPRFAGTAEQEPLRAMQMASFMTGNIAAVATMCALHARKHTGIGQQVDVSQQESMLVSLGAYNVYWPYEHRSVSRVTRAEYAPLHCLKCKDGWVMANLVEEHHWRKFVEVMGNPEWANLELFKDAHGRAEHWESLESLIMEWTMRYTKTEIFEASRAQGIPVGPSNSIPEVLESRQLNERDFFIDVAHPETGKLIYPGAPYKFSKTPWAVGRPAPLLGQHNVDIYCKRLGYSKQELVKMYQAGVI